MAGLTYGAPDYESFNYKYKSGFPLIACEGEEKWVRITLTNDELNTTFLGSANKTIGLLSGIDPTLIPVEIQVESTDMDTHATPTLDIDFSIILNDGSNTELGLKEDYSTNGAAIDTSFGLDSRGESDFETDADTLDELREVIGSNNYDLILAVDTASATAAAGTAEISVKFMRDARDLTDVKNSAIAGGQA